MTTTDTPTPDIGSVEDKRQFLHESTRLAIESVEKGYGAPCPMCMSAIYWARIDRVYFGTRLEDTSKIGFDDEFQYIDFRLPWEQRKAIQCFPDFERDFALQACQAWMNKTDRHPY